MSHLKCSDVAPHKYGEEHPGGSSSEAHCCWRGVEVCTCGYFRGQSLGLLHWCEAVGQMSSDCVES